MQRMINTHIEASKIGSHIAEQVLDYQRRIVSESSGNNLTLNHLYMCTILCFSKNISLYFVFKQNFRIKSRP